MSGGDNYVAGAVLYAAESQRAAVPADLQWRMEHQGTGRGGLLVLVRVHRRRHLLCQLSGLFIHAATKKQGAQDQEPGSGGH